MSNSLTVHRIENICSEFKNLLDFAFDNQKELSDWSEDKGSIPKTSVKYNGKKYGFIHYNVSSASRLIMEPIYVIEKIENFFEYYDRGYSKVDSFQLLIDSDYKHVYIFAPKKVASSFTKLANKEKKLSCSDIPFNFSSILHLEKLISAWGFWETSDGAITKIARFGRDVTTEIADDEYSSITSMNIDYEYMEKTVQLILNSEGRISTQNKLSNLDMISIYNEISHKLTQNTTNLKNVSKRSKLVTFDDF
ncbi:hypothetical protein V7O61_03050 [Methanolobus sp. WCC1]|uniref:hypothetical protein n=1 Tax=unclassified Methanolobus TaxID=2629569 RepID=UPI003245353D